jgi:hypothetical protein
MAETQSPCKFGNNFTGPRHKHGDPCESSDLEDLRYRGVDALLTTPQLPVEHNDAHPGIHVRLHTFREHQSDFLLVCEHDEEQ